jgi:hypothetical protein
VAHVLACYAIVIGALLAYGLTLSRSRKDLRKSLAGGRSKMQVDRPHAPEV